MIDSDGVGLVATGDLTKSICMDTFGCMFTVCQTEEFIAWLDHLKDKRAQVRIAARLRQAEAGNLGDWQPIEGGEFRKCGWTTALATACTSCAAVG